MTRVVWSEQAAADLESIREYISHDSPRYAEIVVQRLIESVGRLTQFPESGRIVPELDRPAIREVIWGSYRLVYKYTSGEARVLTVFRASRLLPTLEYE